MTTYSGDSQVCSVCGRSIDCTVLTSTNSFGSSDLDLRPPEMQRSTMGVWLQECPACHYVHGNLATPTAGAKERVLSEEFRSLVVADHIPELARRFLRYSMLQSHDLETCATALLRAAWVCDDCRKIDQARAYRSEAASMLLTLAPFADSEAQATLATTVVDMLRRSGRFDEAQELAERLQEYESVKSSDVMLSVLRFQLRLCDRADTECHTIGELS